MGPWDRGGTEGRSQPAWSLTQGKHSENPGRGSVNWFQSFLLPGRNTCLPLSHLGRLKGPLRRGHENIWEQEEPWALTHPWQLKSGWPKSKPKKGWGGRAHIKDWATALSHTTGLTKEEGRQGLGVRRQNWGATWKRGQKRGQSQARCGLSRICAGGNEGPSFLRYMRSTRGQAAACWRSQMTGRRKSPFSAIRSVCVSRHTGARHSSAWELGVGASSVIPALQGQRTVGQGALEIWHQSGTPSNTMAASGLAEASSDWVTSSPRERGAHCVSGTSSILSKQNLSRHQVWGRHPSWALRDGFPHSPPAPQLSISYNKRQGSYSSPILTVKDMHTKCFLITTFMADAVISLDFTAISFSHRFILSYSPWILLASPEPSLLAPHGLSARLRSPGEMESLVEPTAQTHIPIHLSHLACALPLSSKPAPAR